MKTTNLINYSQRNVSFHVQNRNDTGNVIFVGGRFPRMALFKSDDRCMHFGFCFPCRVQRTSLCEQQVFINKLYTRAYEQETGTICFDCKCFE